MSATEDLSKTITEHAPEIPLGDDSRKSRDARSRNQIEFVKRTAGKIEVDEKAIEELRTGSMI